jgi:hypothetical protein
MSKPKKQFRLQEASYAVSKQASPARRRRSETESRIGEKPEIRRAETGAGMENGVTDPICEPVSEADRTQVELRASELVVLARELSRSLEPRPQSALRALAVWARLARVEPRALPVPTQPRSDKSTSSAKSAHSLAAASATVVDHSAQWVEAMSLIAAEHAKIWLDRAHRLQQAYLGVPDSRHGSHHTPHQREHERSANTLLLDLDDMELAYYAATELNHLCPTFGDAVSRCRQWFSENVHAFLSCGNTVTSELRVMRRDLPTVNWALSQTVYKYLEIRSAIEEMDQDLSFAPLAARQE